MAAKKIKGLPITQEGNVFRIHCGQDIDRSLRIQDLRDRRRLCREIDDRKAKAAVTAQAMA